MAILCNLYASNCEDLFKNDQSMQVKVVVGNSLSVTVWSVISNHCRYSINRYFNIYCEESRRDRKLVTGGSLDNGHYRQVLWSFRLYRISLLSDEIIIVCDTSM